MYIPFSIFLYGVSTVQHFSNLHSVVVVSERLKAEFLERAYDRGGYQVGFAIPGSRYIFPRDWIESRDWNLNPGIQCNPRNLDQFIFDEYSPHFIDVNPC